MKNKYVLKPLDNCHLFYVLLFRSVGFFVDIFFLADTSDIFWLVVVIVYDFATIVFYVLLRLIYRARYVIDDEYLTKYRGKKVLFKIRKTDIKQVIIRRIKWYEPLLVVLFAFLEAMFDSGPVFDPMFTNISIVFKNCVILKQDSGNIKGDYLYHESDCYEWREVMSYHKGKKLCKLIDIKPTAYKFPKQ